MSIHDRMTAIRDLINQGPTVRHLVRDEAKWNRLCAAMDIVSDTQHAIDAHGEVTSANDLGLMYLAHYGLLQVLLVQQDATKAMWESLGLGDPKFNRQSPTKEIRTWRDRAVGHAVSGRDQVWGIIQVTMNAECFDVYNFGADSAWEHVDTKRMRHDQEVAVGAALDKVVDHLTNLAASLSS